MSKPDKKCSWCNRELSDYRIQKMIEGPDGIAICDECVCLCAEIIELVDNDQAVDYLGRRYA